MPVQKTTTTTTTTTTRHSSSSDGYHFTHWRFNAWVALTVLSLVALCAIVAATTKNHRDFQERWCLSMACISMSLGFFASLGHGVTALRQRFVGSAMELVFAILCVLCWIFALPMITTPDDGLAVDPGFQVDDANLYFSSWGAFIFANFLVASVGNERGMSAARDPFARRWLWLIVSSLVVMAASSRMFDRVCATKSQQQVQQEFCKELKLGISLGVISAVIAGFMTFVLWSMPERVPINGVGFFFAIGMCCMWGSLIAFLTFGNGPGSTVGNLFFATWVSAILSLDLWVMYTMSMIAYTS